MAVRFPSILALILLVNVRESHTSVIKIAVLLPANDNMMFSINRIKPAIRIAISKVTRPQGLLPDHRMQVSYANSNCSSAEAMNEAINFYIHNQPNIFFGPCCDYAAAPVARQIRYWHIPMMTQAIARDFAKGKLELYSTVTRVGGSIDKLAEFFWIVMKNFRWKQMKIIYEPEGLNIYMERLCHIMADGMHFHFAEAYNIVTPYYMFANVSKALENMADEIGTRHAVANGICGEDEAVCGTLTKKN